MVTIPYLTYFALHLYCIYGNGIMLVEVLLLLYGIPTTTTWDSHKGLSGIP
jgi:hypothetical protein